MQFAIVLDMKKKLFVSLVVFASLVFGCKPNEKQIERTWSIVSVTQAGTNLSANYIATGYKEIYGKNSAYSYSGQPGSNPTGSGSYTWDNKTTFKRNGTSSQPSVTCTIKILDNNDFQYTYVDKGDEWIFTFKK